MLVNAASRAGLQKRKDLASESSVIAAGALLRITPRIPIWGFRSGGTGAAGWTDWTVTRVVAATENGAAKAIVSYASDAMSPEEAKSAEPWKKGDLKGKMILMRLRVKETPTQLALFGWNTVQRELIPLEMDRDRFFPQYVPVRERCDTPESCVQSFRQLPEAVKADPPLLTTGLLFGTSENPYNLAMVGGLYIQLCEGSVLCAPALKLSVWYLVVHVNIGFIWSAATVSRKGGCVHRVAKY